MAYNRPTVDRVPIFTIGYGAREIDAFIAALQQQRIEFLLDVRSRPYSVSYTHLTLPTNREV